MTLTIYGVGMSTCAKRVGIILHEKQIPFNLQVVDWTGLKSPEYLEKHPFGQVPYLEDDGFLLFESRAMSKYLAMKYAGQGTQDLVPDFSNLQAVAKFDQASSVEAFDFEGIIYPFIVEWFMRFTNPEHVTDHASLNKQVDLLEGKLEGYERILSKQRYLAGDNLTVVDLFHLPHGTLVPSVLAKDPFDNEKRPNVARWWKELQARPSWLAVKDGVESKERYN